MARTTFALKYEYTVALSKVEAVIFVVFEEMVDGFSFHYYRRSKPPQPFNTGKKHAKYKKSLCPLNVKKAGSQTPR